LRGKLVHFPLNPLGSSRDLLVTKSTLRPNLDTLGLECFVGIGEGVNPQYIKYSLNISQSTPIPLITRVPKLGLRGTKIPFLFEIE
jgi:hypothetical protein